MVNKKESKKGKTKERKIKRKKERKMQRCRERETRKKREAWKKSRGEQSVRWVGYRKNLTDLTTQKKQGSDLLVG